MFSATYLDDPERLQFSWRDRALVGGMGAPPVFGQER